jgi:electron transfer flavoprotein alpha subunit
MIIGIIEHDRGTLREESLQMLTFARELAARLDTPLGAVLIGEAARPLFEAAQAYGAATVYWFQDERLNDYAPQAWAKSIVQLAEAQQPAMVLAAATERGNEILARVAAHKELPLATHCSEVRGGEPFELTRMRWGGSLLEDCVLEGVPKLMTIALHVAAAEEAPSAQPAALETMQASLAEGDFQERIIGREETVTEGITLKTAPVVIGGGRGVGSEEGYRVLEKLAEILGGAVGGSRVATNNGWRPHSDQIGLTGNRIAPELYIACGISGAIQHLVGCKGAKKILVINNDPEAPFFGRADYGVVGNLHEVVPAIVEALEKEKQTA